MEIYRYHGLGNDYLVVDPQCCDLELNEERIRLICDRNFGIGSDGILYKDNSNDKEFRVKIFNPDGSEAEKSGNGVRIFAKYLKDAGYVNEAQFTLHTLGGDVVVNYLDPTGSNMKVFMGKGTFYSDKIPVTGDVREVINEEMVFGDNSYHATCVSVGNPHCVIFCEEVNRQLACEVGPMVENSALFPNRINTQFVKVINKNKIQIEIYERGAGYTMASGSSSCAAAFAAYRNGKTGPKLTVCMPGGELEIEIDGVNIYMVGPVNSIGKIVLDAEFENKLKNLS